MSRRRIWSPRFAVVGLLIALSLVLGLRARTRDGQMFASASAARLRMLPPLPVDDADRDGLADAREAALTARFAPVVVLDPQEAHRPASIDWLLARLPAGARLGGDEDQFSSTARAGSADPHDWVTYVHAFPRAGGGVNLQYWFFYPYNDAPLSFFDHEGDWEHVTVQVDAEDRPVSVSYAQHGNNKPGVTRPWSAVRRTDDHPMVLSARGTHASYPDPSSVAWFDRTSRCEGLAGCGDPIWRTWEAGGLVNMGERGAALGAPEALAYEGRRGSAGRLLRSRPAPHGPFYQGGFWAGGL